jgi:hypothetical protein
MMHSLTHTLTYRLTRTHSHRGLNMCAYACTHAGKSSCIHENMSKHSTRYMSKHSTLECLNSKP